MVPVKETPCWTVTSILTGKYSIKSKFAVADITRWQPFSGAKDNALQSFEIGSCYQPITVHKVGAGRSSPYTGPQGRCQWPSHLLQTLAPSLWECQMGFFLGLVPKAGRLPPTVRPVKDLWTESRAPRPCLC